jgi:hypothetical protein
MAGAISIYRYLDSDAALKTLVSGAFRVGKISTLNDPFEWEFGVVGVTPEESQIAERLWQSRRQWNDAHMGILCFSDLINDPILWSLYAEKHGGAAFEITNSWREDDIRKMSYSNERPVMDYQKFRRYLFDNNYEAEFDQYIKSILERLSGQKSLKWSFESEYRLTFDLKNPSHCYPNSGRYYWRIPKEFLTRVILGFRCPLEEIQVRKLLDMNGFQNTKVIKAKMCSETYAILC